MLDAFARRSDDSVRHLLETPSLGFEQALYPGAAPAANDLFYQDFLPSSSGSLPGFDPETPAEHQPEHCHTSREHALPTAARLLQRSPQPHYPDNEPSLLPSALPLYLESMEIISEYGPPTSASACLSGSQPTTPPLSNVSEVHKGRDEEQGQMKFVSGISCPMTNLKRPAPEQETCAPWAAYYSSDPPYS
eukprot:gene22180-29242_t